MKHIATAAIIVGLSVLISIMAYALQPTPQYVAGRLYIRSRGISAEVYTRHKEPMDGMSSIWSGGRVSTKADLSAVQVGDMAELYTVEGEHLVLECIEIRKGWGWWEKPEGDVIVIDGKWVCRLTRL